MASTPVPSALKALTPVPSALKARSIPCLPLPSLDHASIHVTCALQLCPPLYLGHSCIDTRGGIDKSTSPQPVPLEPCPPYVCLIEVLSTCAPSSMPSLCLFDLCPPRCTWKCRSAAVLIHNLNPTDRRHLSFFLSPDLCRC